MVIAQWDGIKFQISGTAATLMNNLRITAQSETEDKTSDGQSYAAIKNRKPTEVTITMPLVAALGNDVQAQVADLIDREKKSKEDYFYASGKKMLPYKLMIIRAEAEEIEISPSGKWVAATVNLGFIQSSGEDRAASAQNTYSGSSAGALSVVNAAKKTAQEQIRAVASTIRIAKLVKVPLTRVASKDKETTSGSKLHRNYTR